MITAVICGRRSTQATAICAMAMLLNQLGFQAASDKVERAVMAVTPRLKSLSAGHMGYTTSQVGDMVASIVAKS